MSNSIPDIALSNATYSRYVRKTLDPKKELIFDDFNSLIEQAVGYQKV